MDNRRKQSRTCLRILLMLGAVSSVLLSSFVAVSAQVSVTPGSVRLSGVLARAVDRNISTERGNIRIIGFGESKSRGGALFFIHGDPEWHRIGAFTQNLRAEEDRVLANHLEWLRGVAARTNVATYFVARTGVFGSDGESLEFRREDSYLSIGRAIDTVMARDGVHNAAIIGHSGGAAVALYHAIALPSPAVRCYSLASGVYNIGAVAEFIRIQKQKDPAVASIDRTRLAPLAFTPMPPEMAARLKYFEPLFRLPEMPADPARKVFVVSDRRDAIAPYFASADLADRLQKLGHQAVLIEAAAKPPTHHYTYDAAVDVALGCLASRAKR